MAKHTEKRKHFGPTTLGTTASLPSPSVMNGGTDGSSSSSSSSSKTFIIVAVVVGGMILLS